METVTLPVGQERLREFMGILQQYKAGKQHTESRIVSSENWWKLRNTQEEKKQVNIGADSGFVSRSGWLHNVIVSKHADAMASYPEPNILPREAEDVGEARMLSAIIPCVLEQNHFEDTYSAAMWQKLKTGTALYKVVWDSGKLHGLGDIAVEQVNLLNVYWEPGVTDIQKSRYFFHTELVDTDILEEKYPHLEGKLKGKSFLSTRFLYDDHVDMGKKQTVIEVYYRKRSVAGQVLHYCRFVGDQVLYATENDPELMERGLYDHGQYPYVFDALYPIEGSPCGYGFVDICRNPQLEIDLLKTSFVKNAMVGATPRYFSRGDGSVNEAEFLDLSKPIVHVSNPSDDALRQIGYSRLDGVYVNVLDRTIQELRETSGNTETSTGNIASGVTAASAIAALQEASGKGSRDAAMGSYRAFGRVVELCIELIRQFYSLPRQFRITGQMGQMQFVSYSNAALKPSPASLFGMELGMRLPVFDIKVGAQKKNAYTRMAQNELALQFFQNGFFNPALAEQALSCLDMMEFEGKDRILQKISANAAMKQQLLRYMGLARELAGKSNQMLAQAIEEDMQKYAGSVSARPVSVPDAEPKRVMLARQASAEASQPEEKA